MQDHDVLGFILTELCRRFDNSSTVMVAAYLSELLQYARLGHPQGGVKLLPQEDGSVLFEIEPTPVPWTKPSLTTGRSTNVISNRKQRLALLQRLEQEMATPSVPPPPEDAWDWRDVRDYLRAMLGEFLRNAETDVDVAVYATELMEYMNGPRPWITLLPTRDGEVRYAIQEDEDDPDSRVC
jgi:hypothetical protein